MPLAKRQQTDRGLECVECGTDTDDGRGWRALLTVGDEDEAVAIYCPECAAREFGEQL